MENIKLPSNEIIFKKEIDHLIAPNIRKNPFKSQEESEEFYKNLIKEEMILSNDYNSTNIEKLLNLYLKGINLYQNIPDSKEINSFTDKINLLLNATKTKSTLNEEKKKEELYILNEDSDFDEDKNNNNNNNNSNNSKNYYKQESYKVSNLENTENFNKEQVFRKNVPIIKEEEYNSNDNNNNINYNAYINNSNSLDRNSLKEITNEGVLDNFIIGNNNNFQNNINNNNININSNSLINNNNNKILSESSMNTKLDPYNIEYAQHRLEKIKEQIKNKNN
jgi:hypothetical protein